MIQDIFNTLLCNKSFLVCLKFDVRGLKQLRYGDKLAAKLHDKIVHAGSTVTIGPLRVCLRCWYVLAVIQFGPKPKITVELRWLEH